MHTYIWDPEDHPEEQYSSTVELAQEAAAILTHISKHNPASPTAAVAAAAAAAAATAAVAAAGNTNRGCASGRRRGSKVGVSAPLPQFSAPGQAGGGSSGSGSANRGGGGSAARLPHHRVSRSTHSGGIRTATSSGSIGEVGPSMMLAATMAGGSSEEGGALSRLLRLTGATPAPPPPRSASSPQQPRYRLHQERSLVAAGVSQQGPSSSVSGGSRTPPLGASGSIVGLSPTQSWEGSLVSIGLGAGAGPSLASFRSQRRGHSGASMSHESGQQLYASGQDLLQMLASEMRREAIMAAAATAGITPSARGGSQAEATRLRISHRSDEDASDWVATEEGAAVAPGRSTGSTYSGSWVQYRGVGAPVVPRQARTSEETPRTRLNR